MIWIRIIFILWSKEGGKGKYGFFIRDLCYNRQNFRLNWGGPEFYPLPSLKYQGFPKGRVMRYAEVRTD